MGNIKYIPQFSQVVLGARGSDTYTFQIYTKNTKIAVSCSTKQ